jgi:hypothetical protein
MVSIFSNGLHNVPANYNYSEHKNPDLELFQNLLTVSDFVICSRDPPTDLSQDIRKVVDDMGEDFFKIREILRGIKPNISVVLQTGWPSWGKSRNGSPNNISNLVEFWNRINEWAGKTNFSVDLFEAFDEPWKNDLSKLYELGPEGPAGAEGFFGWWRRYDTNETVTYIPKAQGTFDICT